MNKPAFKKIILAAIVRMDQREARLNMYKTIRKPNQWFRQEAVVVQTRAVVEMKKSKRFKKDF